MKIVILEAESLGEDMKLDRFFEIGEVAIYGKTLIEQVPERIAEADAVIVNKLPMNEDTLKDAKYLKYIGLTATGTNNIDFDYTNKRGITVTNVAGYSTEVVAQHTFAMTLYLMEHLRYYDDYVKSGEYTNSDSFCHMERKFSELSGKTWGIIGLGSIGRKVAQICLCQPLHDLRHCALQIITFKAQLFLFVFFCLIFLHCSHFFRFLSSLSIRLFPFRYGFTHFS